MGVLDFHTQERKENRWRFVVMSWENELLWLVIEYYCSTYVIYVFITAVTSSIVGVFITAVTSSIVVVYLLSIW